MPSRRRLASPRVASPRPAKGQVQQVSARATVGPLAMRRARAPSQAASQSPQGRWLASGEFEGELAPRLQGGRRAGSSPGRGNEHLASPRQGVQGQGATRRALRAPGASEAS